MKKLFPREVICVRLSVVLVYIGLTVRDHEPALLCGDASGGGPLKRQQRLIPSGQVLIYERSVLFEMKQELEQYLQPTPSIDFGNPVVAAYATAHAGGHADPRQQAVSLYYAVRDGIRYDPYTLDLSIDGLRASTTLSTGRGWCVAKAILLAACCRAQRIPARLGFADVRNHLTTARMREQMKTDVFYWHGYTSIYLDGGWFKATPAFNIELCQRFRLHPLDFDGRSDSIYHPFDLEGNRHMEYLAIRGEFADVPLDQIMETFRREYLADSSWNDADFDREVEKETQNTQDPGTTHD